MDKGDCSFSRLIKAVEALALVEPMAKHRILRGLADSAQHDKSLTQEEIEIIRAIAAVLDSPLPRFIDFS